VLQKYIKIAVKSKKSRKKVQISLDKSLQTLYNFEKEIGILAVRRLL